MEVDYPVPARTVVLTVAVDGPAEITVLAGGADGTELYRGKGAWSALAPPERQEELRRITVRGASRWQLRLHDPAEAAGPTGPVTGAGPGVFVHRGGTAVVDVTHRSWAADLQLFRLVRHTAAGGREVLATSEWSGNLSWSVERTLLLEGPQVLVVEQGEEWSLTGRPADLPPSTETLRYGIGDRREVFAWPDGTRPALLEFETGAEPDGSSVQLELTTHGGRRLDDVFVDPRHGVQRLLLWAEPDRRARGPFRVEVSGARGGWRLELLPVEEARELADGVEGAGNDVLVHTGPPAVLRVRALGAEEPSARVEVGGRWISTDHGGPGEWAGAMPIGGPPLDGEPEQVRVRSHDRWRLEVVPLAEVPVFDRGLAGRGAAVFRWTGPPGRLTVRTGRWRGGHAEVSVLDERLEPLGTATTFGRRRHEPVELPSGCLVAVHTWGVGDRRWRLVVR
nr:hypothetical protein KPHV_48760 [Kitasatospora purpeofusca]